jgi:hypothetical protein
MAHFKLVIKQNCFIKGVPISGANETIVLFQNFLKFFLFVFYLF